MRIDLGSGVHKFLLLDNITVDSDADLETELTLLYADGLLLRRCRRFELHLAVGAVGAGAPNFTIESVAGRTKADNTRYVSLGVGLGAFDAADTYLQLGWYDSILEPVDRLALQVAGGSTLDGSNYFDGVSAWLIGARE